MFNDEATWDIDARWPLIRIRKWPPLMVWWLASPKTIGWQLGKTSAPVTRWGHAPEGAALPVGFFHLQPALPNDQFERRKVFRNNLCLQVEALRQEIPKHNPELGFSGAWRHISHQVEVFPIERYLAGKFENS